MKSTVIYNQNNFNVKPKPKPTNNSIIESRFVSSLYMLSRIHL